MFTGIIEEVGTIKNIVSSSQSMQITIEANIIMSDIKLGDSIAINGTCLTVTTINNNCFNVDIMPETFNTTSLKNSSIGTKINLERSLAVGGRLGGHFVTGHVDGTGIITKITPNENAIYYEIKFENPKLLQYCIYHGSVAIDGISLTIFGITDKCITISIIPHTIKNTIIDQKAINDIVNIECDMLAKYVQKSMANISGKTILNEQSHDNIDQNFLQQNGFI